VGKPNKITSEDIMPERTILHVDLDAFFCSVEVLLTPELAGKAFVVGGTPEGRGVVASASYEARAFGIRSAMPTAQALRLAPELIIVSHRHTIYGDYSKQVMSILREQVPLMQQISIDEAYLDVSGDPRTGEQIASQLQAEIHERLGLPTSWGIAANKLVAKIASDVGKPRGLIVVSPGTEREFLAPLPVRMIPGVGPKTADRLLVHGVKTIGDLAALSPVTLQSMFGVHGLELAASSHGEDDRPVHEDYEPKSMSAERTFATDIEDETQLNQVLLRLSEEVGHRLRKSGVAGWTVKIKIRWPDFTTITRQVRLEQNTDADGEIYEHARKLFKAVWKSGRAVRLLGVGVSDLGSPVRQLSLFDGSWQEQEKLRTAIDKIRSRFGRDALRRAGGMRPPHEQDHEE
jgi:DNA polymerase-4